MYKKYQVSIHHDPPEKVTKSQFKRFLCNSSLLHESDEEDEDASRGAFHMQVVEFGLHLHYLLKLHIISWNELFFNKSWISIAFY